MASRVRPILRRVTASFRTARISEHTFLVAPITPQSTVVDLGVNLGTFATSVIQEFGCSVVGVEPVPHLFDAIRATEGLTVERLAIAAEARQVTMFLSDSIYAATIDPRLSEGDAPSVEVSAVSFGDLLDRFGLDRVPLVKVDIEGAEIEMFDTTPVETLQRVDQFSIEFHDFLDPSHAADVQRVRQRLHSAGFAEMSFSTDNTDVLFVNQARVQFTGAQKAAAALFYKYPRGVSRNLQRRYENWQHARRTTAS